MVFAEKNQTYMFHKVDLRAGEQKNPDHLKRNPFGVVPVLDDDGFVIYESRAIIRYLDAKLPGIALTPTEIHQRTRMDQFMDVEHSYFSGPALDLVRQLHWGPMRGETPDQTIVDAAKAKVELALDVIEAVLTDQPYLAGPAFSLADITWMPYIDYLFPSGLGKVITSRPHVDQWWRQVSSRSAWQKVIQP
jgi:glutathione S-transferase